MEQSTDGSTSSRPDPTRVGGVDWPQALASLFDGRAWIGFVVFGGMVALQSSAALDATKIAYLVGTVLCVLAALVALWRARATLPKIGLYWLAASAGLGVLIGISFLVARAEGTATIEWLRDVAGYGLFAAIPAVALAGHASATRKVLVGMLVVAGLLGGLSWAVEWLGRRQILELPISRLVFPSGQLPGLLYLFAMASALTMDDRRARWVLVAGGVLGLFLLTGTRSSLLLLIGPLAIAVLLGRARIGESVRSLAAHAIVAVALVAAFQLMITLPSLVTVWRAASDQAGPGPAPTLGPIVIGDRIGSLPVLVGSPASDPSFKERVAQYEAAWAIFVSHPIAGAGPGHPIEWIDVSGYRRSAFTADTPLVMPAKFGLLGILAFLGLGAAFLVTARTALRRARQSAVTLTLLSYGLWTVVSLPLGFPVEDKGTNLSLVLLLALAFADRAAGPREGAG